MVTYGALWRFSATLAAAPSQPPSAVAVGLTCGYGVRSYVLEPAPVTPGSRARPIPVPLAVVRAVDPVVLVAAFAAGIRYAPAAQLGDRLLEVVE